MTKTPLEEYAKKQIHEAKATAKMQANLNKYGRRDAAGGMVWTSGDLARYFADVRKRNPTRARAFDKALEVWKRKK